ncbi:unnamed protein product [Durusdinium trenchii]|uniref:Uncharacterized protein n=1 Tax=Durusdinium trenchii TaxID=1381693 RepID=A0ABP0S4N9_9DINO
MPDGRPCRTLQVTVLQFACLVCQVAGEVAVDFLWPIHVSKVPLSKSSVESLEPKEFGENGTSFAPEFGPPPDPAPEPPPEPAPEPPPEPAPEPPEEPAPKASLLGINLQKRS